MIHSRHFKNWGAAFLFLSSCTSAPPIPTSPEWIRTPSRTVDAGYIVFVGTGQDALPEKASFKAESQALQDLANECSFAPKGTRIEDHFQEKSGPEVIAYAKIGISFIDCDAAKAANDPESIKKIASTALAEQLKRYQDLVYAPAEEKSETNDNEGTNPMIYSALPPPADEGHFFIVRQRVAYLKETIILAPAPVYVSSAPRTVAVTQELSTQSNQLRNYEQANPGVRASHQTWSNFEKNPTVDLPRNIPHPHSSAARAQFGGKPGKNHAEKNIKSPDHSSATPTRSKRKKRRHP